VLFRSIDPALGRDVKAECDGIVTRIYVVRGTAAVKAGDAVRRGQVLIAGYTLDPNGVMTECRAEGEVFARVWYSSSRLFFPERIVYERTGNSRTERDVTVFGLRFKGKSAAAPYAHFETETCRTRAFERFFAPVWIERRVIYEVAEKLIKADFEREKADLFAQTLNEAQFLADGRRSVNTVHDVRDMGNYISVTCNIEVERTI
jgi:hypothetical protein